MAEVIEITGKTVEEALKKALDKLGVSKDEVTYEVIVKPSSGFLGIFGGREAKLRVTTSPKPAEKIVFPTETIIKSPLEPNRIIDAGDQAKFVPYDEDEKPAEKINEVNPAVYELAENFLRDIFRAMDVDVTFTREDKDDNTVYKIQGKNLGVLIGKHGQTIDSLQYLTNLVANKNPANGYLRIVLDVEDYRSRREETLKKLANNLAEKAMRIGGEVKLEPMSRHERKIIHMALQDHKRVTTYSAGENPRRYVVIAPKRREKSERSERGGYGRSRMGNTARSEKTDRFDNSLDNKQYED